MKTTTTIGLPSVVKAGSRLAIFYDGNGSAKMPSGDEWTEPCTLGLRRCSADDSLSQ